MKELIDDLSALGELSGSQSIVDTFNCRIHLMQDPLFANLRGIEIGIWCPSRGQPSEDIFACLPDLVTESPLRVNKLDVKADVTPTSCVVRCKTISLLPSTSCSPRGTQSRLQEYEREVFGLT